MSQTARQRSAAQRRQKAEDITAADDGPILDEEEQDQEIQKLKSKNEKENISARRIIDVGILAASLLTIFQIFKRVDRNSDILLRLVALMQSILLPFSLASTQLLHPAIQSLQRYHHFILAAHGLLLAIAIYTLLHLGIDHHVGDIAQTLLPIAVAGLAEMQRRGEAETERHLTALERAKYKLKGA